LSQKTHTTFLKDFCVLNFFGRGEPLSQFHWLFFVYGSYAIWIRVSSILRRRFKNPTVSHWNRPKIASEASTRSRFGTASSRLGTNWADSFLVSKLSWIIYPTPCRDTYRQGLCCLLREYFSIVHDHGMNGVSVFWNRRVSWSHRTLSSVLEWLGLN
jgi:hypothetical protein